MSDEPISIPIERYVTVTEIHRIKGLQKERVPVNIEVAPTIPKGALR
jgi:hypothetical protein